MPAVISRTIEAAGAAGPGAIRDSAGEDDSVYTERLYQLKDLMEKIGDILDTFIESDTLRFRRTTAETWDG